ncbi:hypothetical protein [Nocardia blacklockiae]|uniref:hypothetical protein n=1 Tax=Nocardia blacklockiae TaxID=480036 RepID=UPI0018932D00|nr:hypothetical protein [Nocardia blacklockiae]MBF6171083.1 hypothetical protein [Nocardia blacklockiae]
MGERDVDKCHVVVEFPTDELPIVTEYQAGREAARRFASAIEARDIAHVRIDDNLPPGLPDLPCERLWTGPGAG